MMCAEAAGLKAPAWNRDGVTRSAHESILLDLYDREQLSLRRYLLYLGSDAETASETVQESFLRLHQHLLAGGDEQHLRAWLYRVAHNLARNAQTSSHSTKTAALDDGTAQTADGRVSAEQELLEREHLERLRRALADLTQAQQRCLVLRSQGLRYREIAEALGLSTSTVAENVQRGLDKLKKTL